MRKFWLMLWLLPYGLVAQQQDSIKRNGDVSRFVDGVIHTFAAPARWNGHDWAKLGGVLAGTAVLTQADVPAREFWTKQKSNELDHINAIGNHYGKPYSAFLFTGGFYLSGLLLKDSWAKETGLMLGTGLFTAGLMQTALKPLLGRARPQQGKGNYEISFFHPDANYHSLPSGHTTMAFTISFIMARRVNSVPLKVGFYSLAASTVVCRLYSDAHWISDIALGSAIAWFCSDIAIKRIENNKFRRIHPKKIKWDVSPNPTGITISASF